MFQSNWLNVPLVMVEKAFEVFMLIYGHGDHFGHATKIIWRSISSFNQWMLRKKVDYNRWPCHTRFFLSFDLAT